jgi:hypothetical protein
MSNLDKLEDLVNAFSEGLKNSKELITVMESVNKAILKMALSDDDKNTLAIACIEAASNLDIDSGSTTQEVINSFNAHLTDELEHLDAASSSPTSSR